MIQAKYKDLTSGQYSALQQKIWLLMVKYCFDVPGIYDNSEPTQFAKKTLGNPLFIESNTVNSVVILSRDITKKQEESKRKFIKKHFGHQKIQYISVPPNGNKAEVIRSQKIPFDVVIDDELPNIRSIAESCKTLEKKEFIIPRYGYNKMTKDLHYLIEGKGGSVTYYEPFKK